MFGCGTKIMLKETYVPFPEYVVVCFLQKANQIDTISFVSSISKTFVRQQRTSGLVYKAMVWMEIPGLFDFPGTPQSYSFPTAVAISNLRNWFAGNNFQGLNVA